MQQLRRQQELGKDRRNNKLSGAQACRSQGGSQPTRLQKRGALHAQKNEAQPALHIRAASSTAWDPECMRGYAQTYLVDGAHNGTACTQGWVVGVGVSLIGR